MAMREARAGWRQAMRVAGVMGIVLLVSSPLTWILADGVGPLVWVKVLMGTVFTGLGLLAWRSGDRADPRSAGLLAVTVGSTLLALVLLVAVNYAAWRRPVQWDATRDRIHSLSDQTEKVLSGLRSDVHILAFFGRDENSFVAVSERLARYAAASSRLSVELVDPRLSPERVQRFRIRDDGPRLVLLCDGREVIAEDASEQALTNAIMRVADPRRPAVHVLAGHGEIDLTDTGAEGFSALRDALQEEGYRVESLTLFDSGGDSGELAIPEDVRALLVLGSRGRLLDAELAALETFLERGGAAIVAVEPGRHSGIESLLATWKVRPRKDVVADAVSQRLGLGWGGPIVQPSHPPHPITESLVSPAVMMTTHSLDLLEGGLARVDVRPLMETGRTAWSEGYPVEVTPPELDGGELRGPLVVAALARHTPSETHSPDGTHDDPGGKLIVFGDVDWMNNRLLGQQGNLDLFLNTIGFSLGEAERIAVRPRKRAATELDLRPADLGILKLVTMDFIPVLLIAFGATVVLSRRRG